MNCEHEQDLKWRARTDGKRIGGRLPACWTDADADADLRQVAGMWLDEEG